VLKAVIDTNVWISALLGTGAPKKLKDCVEQKQFQPVYATELIDELVEVLARPKFAKKITDIDTADLVRLIRKNAILLQLEQVTAISRDPKGHLSSLCSSFRRRFHCVR
jgi:putative PIN family toxin of toxin-antitoxin system